LVRETNANGAKTVVLGELMAASAGSVDPLRYPEELFDLYSVHSFDRGQPDVLAGREIGSSKPVVKTGDVLLCRIVPHIRRSWIVGRDRGRRLIASGEWIVFRSERFDPEYLRHLLVGDAFHAQFMRTVAGVGGSLLRARPAAVANIPIPLPPMADQRRFAHRIGAVRKVLAAYQSSSTQLSALVASLQQRTFRGEL
jgi:type I restriction enzyme S subunit